MTASPVPTRAPGGAAAPRAELVVDLAAVRHNVATLKAAAAGARMMTVVKADGYGHGMVEVARSARAAGAEWLGVAVAEEAMALRAAGDTGRILSWLAVPGEDYRGLVGAEVDVTAYTVEEVDEVAAAARDVGTPARLQLKVDTGLNRGGSTEQLWPDVVRAAAKAEESGAVRVTGVWSHFACSDEPDHPANDAQERVFRESLAVAEAAGLQPEVRHLANSAAALLRPSARFDLVRCGIASYGLSPAPDVVGADELGLVPAMTARARLAIVKRVPAGAGVSYGHTYYTPEETTLAVVPVGYGDGIPRHASNRAEVLVDGVRRPVRGRICMDQFVVDLGASAEGPGQGPRNGSVAGGAEAVLFGTGRHGEPTAQDWAEACGTISYEIVTRIGGRMVRRYVDSDATNSDATNSDMTNGAPSEAGKDTR